MREFVEFVGAWLGPAAQRYVFATSDRHTERVEDAIRAIAAGENRPPPIGYVVCQRETLTHYDRDHRSGFVYTPVSAVSEHVYQARNAYEYCTAKRQGDFVICADYRREGNDV